MDIEIEETKTRSIIKAIILRVIIFVLTTIYIMVTGGTFLKCVELSILDVCLELVTHYIYERFWQNIRWGIKIKKKID